jgi:hypothetical protein
MNEEKGKRIIGLDMHPDVFAAAALSADQSRQNADWVQDRMLTAGLEGRRQAASALFLCIMF